MLERRDWLRMIGFGLPAWPLLGAPSFPTTVADRVDRLFRAPGPQPSALQATKDGLWVLDQGTGRASLVSYAERRVTQEVDTKTAGGRGITFDGISLWVASSSNRMLVKVDVETGETLGQFPSPGAEAVQRDSPGANARDTGVHGLEWRRGELFMAVPLSATIYVVKAQDGSVARSFPSPGVRPHGLGWDPDGTLWCAESTYRSFFKLDPASGKIIKQHMLPFTGPQGNGKLVVPRGMTIWNRYIYFCAVETGEVYRTPLVNRMS